MRLILLLSVVLAAPLGAQRTYWKMDLDTLAAGHKLHTHVEVAGRVAPNYPKSESDGDRHIKLMSLKGTGAYVIVECIPLLPSPCAGIRAGDSLTVRGITRRDPEHGWMEIHPAESVTK